MDVAKELADLDATAIASAIAGGELTAEEAVGAAIAACEALDPELNAVIHPAFERALGRASQASGPLAGVPMLTKDLVCREDGLPFHEGSRFLRELGWTGDGDQDLAVRFRELGLVSIGRTNTPEFGMRPVCEPEAYGATRNPWDPTRTTGGSSGGSAAAVAAGIVPVAHANDVGGSIRNPASMCGLVGLKPSRGRTPMGPDFGDAMGGLAEELVVTRSVRDTAAVLAAVAVPEPGDWHASWPLADPLEAVRREPGRLRIGFSVAAPGAVVDASVATVVADAAATLARLGHDVEPAAPEALAEDISSFALPHYAAGTTWVVDHHWPRVTGLAIPADQIEPGTAMLAELGRGITAAQLLEARELAQAWTRRLAAWWRHHDVLVVPTLPMLPPGIGTRDPAGDTEFLAFLAPFNVSGQPALPLPLGEVDGLPVGVQFVAAHGREDLLLSLAAQLETEMPWSARRPGVHVATA